MGNTEKHSCIAVAEALRAAGIRHAVLSPGSRDVPMMTAMECCPDFETHVAVDERSAAFAALGMAAASGNAVALVCTSGTAPLNYAPAVAEAYYRQIPLVVITCDRPAAAIDRDLCQTIRQPGIYANFIKEIFDIGTDDEAAAALYTACIAASLALSAPQGPVHLNLRLDEPLGGMSDACPQFEPQISVAGVPIAADSLIDEVARETVGRRVLIIAGSFAGGYISESLLNGQAHVVVLSELQSNLNRGCGGIIRDMDGTFARLADKTAARLDVVITMGCSFVSGRIKKWLSSLSGLRHIHVGPRPFPPDTFGCLERCIPCEPLDFMSRLLARLETDTSASLFRRLWTEAAKAARTDSRRLLDSAPWCDFVATGMLMDAIPMEYNLHLSNGMAVRYAQFFDVPRLGRCDCNRGVSGIDGSTSTAIGQALVSSSPTVLLSGDMSFQYDIGALSLRFIPPTMRMAVLNNGGGGIFDTIAATKTNPCGKRFFSDPMNLPLKDLCRAYGFDYYPVRSRAEMQATLPRWLAPALRPAVLDCITDSATGAAILDKYLLK